MPRPGGEGDPVPLLTGGDCQPPLHFHANVIQVQPQLAEHADRGAVTLPQQAEQQVLGPHLGRLSPDCFVSR